MLPMIESRGPVSGLPYPSSASTRGRRLTGAPGDVTILDWAGFGSALSYTFDDGEPSQLEHYEELAAAGAPFSFYVSKGWESSSPDFVGAWSRAARDGHELGNHTVHHPRSDLKGSIAGGDALASHELEIAEDEEYLRKVLGQKNVWSMASPFGDQGWNRHAGRFYAFNRGVQEGRIAPGDDSDPLDLPVFMAKGGESEDELNGRVGAARAEGSWLIFVFHTLAPTKESWYAPVDIAAVTGSLRRAKDRGDVWIDALYKIAAYWLGQRIVESARTEASGDGVCWTWKLPEHFPAGCYLRAAARDGSLMQDGKNLVRDASGFFEISLDSLSLTLSLRG
jgi:peptidoglycan/xylan/chitin deacetylase (PgdA/CDA1 family)